jgi:hypothetical protein
VVLIDSVENAPRIMEELKSGSIPMRLGRVKRCSRAWSAWEGRVFRLADAAFAASDLESSFIRSVMSRQYVSVEDEAAGRMLACRVKPCRDIRLRVLGAMRKNVCHP